MEGVLFVLGIEENTGQRYNRNKHRKWKFAMAAGCGWTKGESYGQKIRSAKS